MMTPNNINKKNQHIDVENTQAFDAYLQPNIATKLSDDFKSQTLAQLIQYFTSGMTDEFIMYRLVKQEVFPKVASGYKAYIHTMLKRSHRFDEANISIQKYFLNSGAEYIEKLESDLGDLMVVLKQYFSGPKAPANDDLSDKILKKTRQISSTYFPDVSGDVSGLIG